MYIFVCDVKIIVKIYVYNIKDIFKHIMFCLMLAYNKFCQLVYSLAFSLKVFKQ